MNNKFWAFSHAKIDNSHNFQNKFSYSPVTLTDFSPECNSCYKFYLYFYLSQFGF